MPWLTTPACDDRARRRAGLDFRCHDGCAGHGKRRHVRGDHPPQRRDEYDQRAGRWRTSRHSAPTSCSAGRLRRRRPTRTARSAATSTGPAAPSRATGASSSWTRPIRRHAARYLLVDNRWSGAKTDIDTIIMGADRRTASATASAASIRSPSASPARSRSTALTALDPVGGSDRLNPRAGVLARTDFDGRPARDGDRAAHAGLEPGRAAQQPVRAARLGPRRSRPRSARSGWRPTRSNVFVDSQTSGAFDDDGQVVAAAARLEGRRVRPGRA